MAVTSQAFYMGVFQMAQFWLAISEVVMDAKTRSIAYSYGKNMENAWDTEMA